MKLQLSTVKRVSLQKIKQLAYTPAVKTVMRGVLNSAAGIPIKRYAERHGFDNNVQRYSDASLPPGKYFAKLTLTEPQSLAGSEIQLKHEGNVIFSYQPQATGEQQPLEFLNIIVNSEKEIEFEITPRTPYELIIGNGPFNTKRQTELDKRLQIRTSHDISFSLRGNVSNPDKLIVTFPDFSETFSTLPYPVETLPEISDESLARSLILSFQDRYLTFGSFLLADNSGNSLSKQITDFIAKTASKYGIQHSNISFFGAGKGATSALIYAENFSPSQIILISPYLSLLDRVSEPDLKYTLGTVPAISEMPSPAQLLRTYLRDGRDIHYFYSRSAELANHSTIELIHDADTLKKYQVGGALGRAIQVSRLPAISLILHSISDAIPVESAVEEIHYFYIDNMVGLQIRINDRICPVPHEAVWFIKGINGNTAHFVQLEDHRLPFVKYTSDDGYLHRAIDGRFIPQGVIGFVQGGSPIVGGVSPTSNFRQIDASPRVLALGPLRLNAESATKYTIVDGNSVAEIEYKSTSVLGQSNFVEVRIVDDLDAFDIGALRISSTARHVVALGAGVDHSILQIFLRRIKVASASETLHLHDERSFPKYESNSDCQLGSHQEGQYSGSSQLRV